MDSHTIKEREDNSDPGPIYPSVQRYLHTIKVIPTYGGDAKIFPSWRDRKSVKVCAGFDPFTLEINIVFLDDNNTTAIVSGGTNEQISETIVISPSFFIIVGDEGRFHITLQRQRDTEDKILAFYKSQCPSGQISLAGEIASNFHHTLMDLSNSNDAIYPSLQLCFKTEKDKSIFFQQLSAAFGRRFEKKYPRETLLHRGIAFHLENPDTIKLNDWKTPTSLQTPRNFKSLISTPLAYERTQLVSQLRLLFERRALEDLDCHIGDGNAESPFTWEIFIPYSRLEGCTIPEYKGLHWQARVMSLGGSAHESIEMVIHEHSIRMLREPLPANARKQHYKYLLRESKLSEWLKSNEKKKYWCLKLLPPVNFSKFGLSRKINLILIPESSQLDQTVLSTLDFSNSSSSIFDPSRHTVIQEIFLGHRLGRLLPTEIYQKVRPMPSKNLLPEQVDIYNHVLKHDFTLVDGAPGTGKSTITSKIISDFIRQGKKVLVLATSEAALDFLASNVLSIVPREHPLFYENIVRVYSYPESWSRDGPNQKLAWNKEGILQRYSVGIHRLSAKNSRKEKDKVNRANAIFMTTETVLNCYKGPGFPTRVFDLIIVDGANTINEGLALKLTRQPFSNSFRWLVIGCSKGIEPIYLIEDFRKMDICNSWFRRLIRHPEFLLNPLRLTRQMRCRNALYQPINDIYFNKAITTVFDIPAGQNYPELCMAFFNTSSVCNPKHNPAHHDEELMEMENYRTEQAVLFTVLNKIIKFSPNASIVILSYFESQEVLNNAKLASMHGIGKASGTRGEIIISTIEDFSDRETDYAIIHLPLWKGSYAEYAEHGKFVAAMTRGRKGVYVVGNHQQLKRSEKLRGAWDNNPWNHWMVWLRDSGDGEIFDNAASFNLISQPKPAATMIKASG